MRGKGKGDDVAEQGMTRVQKAWLARGIMLGVLLMVVCVAVFWVYPSVRRRQMEARFEAVSEYVRDNNAEAALAEYLAIEKAYAGSEAARRARSRAEELVPSVEGAARLNGQAESALRNKEFESAWRLYKQLAAEYPGTRKGSWAKRSLAGAAQHACNDYWEKGVAAEKEFRWEEAKVFYGKIIGIDPDYPGGQGALEAASAQVERYRRLMTEAEGRVKAKDWEGARSRFEAALKIQPKDAKAYAGRCLAVTRMPPPAGMAVIPPGDYVVGADDGEADERPRRTVRAEGCYLDIHEVTNREYGAFVKATGHRPPPHWGGKAPSEEIGSCPVVCVSWHDAAAYAKWAGKRLPTAEEWERAAGGFQGARYPWGEEFSYANGVFAHAAAGVGSCAGDRSPLGCLDMAGNVSEWTGTKGGGGYLIRGGSWLGLEKEREDRAVADDIATVGSDPRRTMLIDAPGAWGLTVRGVSEVKFFLRGSANERPVIEIRKYVPVADRYAVAGFVLNVGDAIGGERDVIMEVGGTRTRMDVVFATGCTLTGVVPGARPADLVIEYLDREGKRHRMGRAQVEREGPALGRADAARAGRFDAVLGAVRARGLEGVVRAGNRMWAPAEASFVNGGFRCARDL